MAVKKKVDKMMNAFEKGIMNMHDQHHKQSISNEISNGRGLSLNQLKNLSSD